MPSPGLGKLPRPTGWQPVLPRQRGTRALNSRVHFFRYRDGKLYCEGVDIARVAEKFGTPTYVYSAGTILDHYTRLDTALAPLDHLICYAVKANSNRAILKLLADAGAGFDIVSGGELFRVLNRICVPSAVQVG